MRVLHVETARTWRGGEAQVLWLAEGLARLGHEVLLLAPRGMLARRAEAEGVPVDILPFSGPWDPRAVRKLVLAVAEWKPHIVHLHTSHAHTLGMLAKLAGAEAKYVVSRRVASPVRSGPKYGGWVKRFVAISEAVRRELSAGGIPPEKVSVVYSGVPVDAISSVLPDGRIRDAVEGKVVFGNASALTREKGHDVLLRAVSFASGRCPNLGLVVAGDGPLRRSLERLSGKLGLQGKVVFLGFRRRIWEVLKALDAFVLPSRREGLGVSILEAMACGLPVIATDVGGISEAVSDGDTGILVPPDDPKAMGEAMVLLASDGKLREEMGRRARERARYFDIERTVRDTEAVYREVVGC